jgi:pimeloyl-ACP methyl ester carboxylesterase
MAQHTSYRTVKVDGLSIFYREAGPKDAPTLLLLHGFPRRVKLLSPISIDPADRACGSLAIGPFMRSTAPLPGAKL